MTQKKFRAIKHSDGKGPAYVTFSPGHLDCIGFGVYTNQKKEIFLQISEVEWEYHQVNTP